MEVPLLRFVREFETHLRLLQTTYPSIGLYIQLVFPNDDATLTFDNESALEENGEPVFDWTLWNGDETEIRAYDAAEECETDEGWCSVGVVDTSACKAFVRYTPVVDGVCINRTEVWQKEGVFCELTAEFMEGIGGPVF
jgi:hypothetical protein